MTALIVTESLFGNTLAIAEAIGGGIAEVHGQETVRVVHASRAPYRGVEGRECRS